MKNRCAACGAIATDQHHIKTRGAFGPDEDWNLLWLCRKDHTRVHTEGINRVLVGNTLLRKTLEAKGWRVENEFGVMKLRRVK